MHCEFLAASRRQPIEIKAARPALIPFQCLLLSVVAEIPDEVAGARLAVEQSRQRLDAVSIDQQHREKLMLLSDLDKTLKLAEMGTFTLEPRENPNRQERYFLPGSTAGVSVPEIR